MLTRFRKPGSRCSNPRRDRLDCRSRPQLEILEPRLLLASATLRPIVDNTLYESATGSLSNGIGIGLFAGVTNQTSGAIRRAALKFDVASVIPAGSQIDSASLTLNVSKSNAGAVDFELHALLADWGEGSTDAARQEGSGGSSTTNSATWLHRFFPTTTWSKQGGDFRSTASAAKSVAGVGVYSWTSAQLTADVQAWLEDPSTQFGWLLKATSESTTGTSKRFDSREVATASNRPLLSIEYTPPVNAAPTLDAIASPADILEDDGPQTINLTGISAGPGENQTLTVTAKSSNPNLIPNPTVNYTSPNATGSLSYAPVSNAFGSAVITVTVKDSGGTANGVDTVTRQFTVNVLSVNDEPGFVKGSSESAADEDGAQTYPNWATQISPGPANESGQAVHFIVNTDLPNLFVVPPAIDAEGTLTFTPRANVRGLATVHVTLQDDGLTDRGGVDMSPSQSFTINITKPFPQHNALESLDVDGNSRIFPLDAILVINYLNARENLELTIDSPLGPPFRDTNPNNVIAPLDALLVINFLNALPTGGEGESRLLIADSTGRNAAVDLYFQQWERGTDSASLSASPRRKTMAELAAQVENATADKHRFF
ncbi:MAG: DNRLRE domain-containing protein [Planctomycetes bacterium]|nr:DNRLRE domain-containing protein [Planctomycetota bacterium]